MTAKYTKQQHLEMNRAGWGEGHRYLAARRRKGPDWIGKFRDGGTTFTEREVELLGDVASLDVLQLSCGGDASQAFSFVNMGANVTACDFSPVAIEEAKQNAARVGLAVRFVLADAQRLSTIGDGASDLVHADGNLWYYEDLPTACRNWYRVLRANGRLFLHENHPLTLWCLEADETDGSLRVVRSYGDTRPEYSPFQIDDFVSKESHEVEFPHTLADILNAIAQAGFVLEQMVECNLSQAGFPIEGLNQSAEKLPHNFYVIARKVP